MSIRLYDIVTSKDFNDPLTSGHIRYSQAVVVQVNPLILKSVLGDMTWYNRKPESLSVLISDNDKMPMSLYLAENPFAVVKQVTLVRTDLRNTVGEKVRTGKMFAQVQHASIKAFRNTPQELIQRWAMNDSYKKIALRVSSEQELLHYSEVLKPLFLGVGLIHDKGLTEFKEPTYTCLSVIGLEKELDKVTGKLSLY